MTSPKRYEVLGNNGEEHAPSPCVDGPYYLVDDVEDALEDAKRYRWLRRGENADRCLADDNVGNVYLLNYGELDRAIDVAMQEGK